MCSGSRRELKPKDLYGHQDQLCFGKTENRFKVTLQLGEK